MTDKALLAKMTAKNRSAKLRAVKTDTSAQAIPRRWLWDNLQGEHDGPAMLAYVKIPSAHGAIIGAWNCRKASTSSWARDQISLQDVEDALELDHLDADYALWSVGHSERNGGRVELISRGSQVEMPLELGRSECEAFVIAKVWESQGRKVAVVGMLDKFATLAGVQVGVKGGRSFPFILRSLILVPPCLYPVPCPLNLFPNTPARFLI